MNQRDSAPPRQKTFRPLMIKDLFISRVYKSIYPLLQLFCFCFFVFLHLDQQKYFSNKKRMTRLDKKNLFLNDDLILTEGKRRSKPNRLYVQKEISHPWRIINKLLTFFVCVFFRKENSSSLTRNRTSYPHFNICSLLKEMSHNQLIGLNLCPPG